jgi:hypothetical protein
MLLCQPGVSTAARLLVCVYGVHKLLLLLL